MTKMHRSAGIVSAEYGAHNTVCGLPWVTSDAIGVDLDDITCRVCRRYASPSTADTVSADMPPSGAYEVPLQKWEHADVALRSIHGEALDTVRWSSVGAALRSWAAWTDEGYPVTSSSAVGRFETGAPRGGSGPSLPPAYRMAEDVVIVQMAIDRVFAEVRVQALDWLDATQHRDVLVMRLCGRPVRSRLPGTKHMRVEREPVSAEELAEVLSGYYIEHVTKHHIGLVVREGLRQLTRELERVGAIPKRVAAKESVRMGLPSGCGFDVEGWKEISELVGRSERTCRDLAKREREPLPTYDYLGKIVARRREIEAWAARQASAA